MTKKILIFLLLLSTFSCNFYEIPKRKIQSELAVRIYDSLTTVYKPFILDSLERSLKFHKIIPNNYSSIDEFINDTINLKFIFIPYIFVNKNFWDDEANESWFNSTCNDQIYFECFVLKSNQYWLNFRRTPKGVYIKDSFQSKLSGIQKQEYRDNLNDFYTKLFNQDFKAVFFAPRFNKNVIMIKNESIIVLGGMILMEYNSFFKEEDFKSYWLNQQTKYVEWGIKDNPCYDK